MDRITIIGAGESGIGAALLAKKSGNEVFVSDFDLIADVFKKELKKNKILFEEKGHSIDRFINADTVIRSPGVPRDAPVLMKTRESGVPVISEIEFGFRHYNGKIIGVTGSNGKTTTTGLLHHLICHAGIPAAVGGNYGTSFCRLMAEDRQESIIVLELSSFQLEDIEDFRPDVAILLNITADHLDRYNNDIQLYAEAKMKLVSQQKSEDIFIFNGDDPIIQQCLENKTLNMNKISVKSKDFEGGIWSKDLNSFFDIRLPGKHNLLNAACVVLAVRELGLSDQVINSGFKSFKNQPHRMEFIADIQQVSFINDSKGTNVDAVWYALDAIAGQAIWIAGGTDKGNDYDPLLPLVRKKVKALICLGIDNQKLIKFFGSVVPVIHETRDIREAVRLAFDLATKGDTILLSPACASFDLFRNYEDRGHQFKIAVLDLAKEIK